MRTFSRIIVAARECRTAAVLLLVFAVASGCATTRRPETSSRAPSRARIQQDTPRRVEHKESKPTVLREAERMLRAEVEEWEGTPHVYGGTSRNGVDCSGLVMVLYQDLFDMRLPRTTSEQVRAGETVSPDELRTGDLVFFRPAKSQHVGIYLSNGEFAHASASRGVMISDINDRYWQETYWTAQRVLKTVPDVPALTTVRTQPVRSSIQRPAGEAIPVASPPPADLPAFGW